MPCGVWSNAMLRLSDVRPEAKDWENITEAAWLCVCEHIGPTSGVTIPALARRKAVEPTPAFYFPVVLRISLSAN